jgi:hypothetical protein
MCKAWYQIAGRDSIFARFARSDDNVGFQRDARDKRAQIKLRCSHVWRNLQLLRSEYADQ